MNRKRVYICHTLTEPEDATMEQFISQQGLSMTTEPIDRNPHMEDDAWAATASHYRCKITKKQPGQRSRSYSLPFSQGSAHTQAPKLAEVLDCLASDASGFENARSFDEWCSEYGYDIDSRKAERTYRIIEKQANRLKAFLGQGAYETLLWNTERL